MLDKGAFHVLSDYARKDDIYPKVIDAFLDGIEELEGPACRAKIAEHGLAKMHEHFPADKVALLEEKFLRRMRTDLYKWTYEVGARDLGLSESFFVDYTIIIRIHFPFTVAKQAKNTASPRLAFSEKLRLMTSALTNWSLFKNLMGRVFGRKASGDEQSFDSINYYHKGLPFPAISHGPHIDTWYGHSYDGINLWWSIDGVEEGNCVILYPQMFGFDLPFDPKTMYIKAGIQLPKPQKIAPPPGELLVFNPEILHGTQVNISDSTRVVITTRLNPVTPRFNTKAPFHFEHWYSSEDLANNKLSKISVFPRERYSGVPRVSRPDVSYEKSVEPRTVPGKLSDGAALRVCDSSELSPGQSISVDLDSAKLLVYRDSGGVHAFSRICPHLGMDLRDGCHDGGQVYCPGHGIPFSLQDGSSPCPDFKLRQYHAFEKDGGIHVQKSAAKAAGDSAPSQS
jgi:nitrite reductase/ring-hydroxylating ferredoxin subunit